MFGDPNWYCRFHVDTEMWAIIVAISFGVTLAIMTIFAIATVIRGIGGFVKTLKAVEFKLTFWVWPFYSTEEERTRIQKQVNYVVGNAANATISQTYHRYNYALLDEIREEAGKQARDWKKVYQGSWLLAQIFGFEVQKHIRDYTKPGTRVNQVPDWQINNA